jgi:hypothetical protein
MALPAEFETTIVSAASEGSPVGVLACKGLGVVLMM